MSVIETVRYRLKDGATQKDALAAWEESQSFARAQNGFLGRKLAVTAEGDFLDHVEWASIEDAKSAAANFDPSKFPELLGLMKVLDESSMTMTHYEVLGEATA
ncbi:antibiotic biosynthesis monooxygenase family protein [Cognatishimia maritima]|uniref:Antibiotic biosynthesis monooxygenase n=1 Tax=Cognatishimia maritima TaxID=870908 RepID=A0A1M5NTH8_9RHOB|nr:hypothetical protein [Cognatishimia maritima]SHG92768.1 hypothetical protein SAMN04488044_1625 [Cognatishimia maritima]